MPWVDNTFKMMKIKKILNRKLNHFLSIAEFQEMLISMQFARHSAYHLPFLYNCSSIGNLGVGQNFWNGS
jgi:hypothetical protein